MNCEMKFVSSLVATGVISISISLSISEMYVIKSSVYIKKTKQTKNGVEIIIFIRIKWN